MKKLFEKQVACGLEYKKADLIRVTALRSQVLNKLLLYQRSLVLFRTPSQHEVVSVVLVSFLL